MIPVLVLVVIGAMVGGLIVSYTSQPGLDFDPIQMDQARKIMRTAWQIPAGTRAQQRPVVTKWTLNRASRSPKKQKGAARRQTAKKRRRGPAIILAHRRPGS